MSWRDDDDEGIRKDDAFALHTDGHLFDDENDPNDPEGLPAGHWGQFATVKYGGDGTNGILGQAPILTLNRSGKRPLPITIDCGLGAPGGGQANYPTATDPVTGHPFSYRAIGQLSYGVTGFRQQNVQFDWVRGQRIVIEANLLDLSVMMLAPPIGYVAGSITLGAAMGFYAATTLAPAMLTSFIDYLYGGTSVTILLPPRANFLLPIQMSDLTGSVVLEFQDTAGRKLSKFQFGNGQMVTPLPCSLEYYQVKVTSTSTDAFQQIQLPWQIAL